MHRSLQVGATCKHFAAYSLEQSDGFGRYFYDAKVTNRCTLCNDPRVFVPLCSSGWIKKLWTGLCFRPYWLLPALSDKSCCWGTCLSFTPPLCCSSMSAPLRAV